MKFHIPEILLPNYGSLFALQCLDVWEFPLVQLRTSALPTMQTEICVWMSFMMLLEITWTGRLTAYGKALRY